MSDDATTEQLLNEVESKAAAYEIEGRNCAQGCLKALQEVFGVGNTLTYKAATAMPGIAVRGETCGAVVAGLMAVGIVWGREDPSDMRSYMKAISQGRKFCRWFEQEFGSVMCRDIVRQRFGRELDLANPDDAREFARLDGYQHCSCVPGKAARTIGAMILESRDKAA